MSRHWYIKNFSEMVGVSVQTLHHYDRIGLLTPELRKSNGYRLYTEQDFFRLKKIIVLRFFGFNTSQQKILLSEDIDMSPFFKAQQVVLDRKKRNLLKASTLLRDVTRNYNETKTVNWSGIK